ncbi:MAG: ParB/RepB/Spo0J family partition protein [Planctomycetes bacterium]|nr:ParB/RepB/Spo0J family partition protein [Planctomycetota bacterium]
MSFADHGLGKSLSEVFARTPRKDGGRGFLDVDITTIVSPGDNPRKQFDAAALGELAESIRLHGILQPIVVMRRDEGYEIVSGERRFRAARQAGLTRVPVVVREEDNPKHLAELRLIENIQREDLNAIELAEAYQALIEEHGLTHEELAERVSKDRVTITNCLRLLTLPPALRAEIASGALGAGHARALVTIADPAWQLQLARRIIDEGLSVRAAEALAKAGPGAGTKPTKGKDKPPHVKELEANLYRLFGTRVQVKERAGKGALTVFFESKDQFQRVVTIMEKVVRQSGSTQG